MTEESSNSNSDGDIERRPENQIKNVWSYNLREEFNVIKKVVEKYKCIAMDTEFPGFVFEPWGFFRNRIEHHYVRVKCNVDFLRMIQLGITFFDEQGNTPTEYNSTWQFNFKFEIDNEIYSHQSMFLLHESGIQFDKHYTDGINPKDFSEVILSSGLLLMNDIKWISFHSEYDFAYLLKVITCSELPFNLYEFYELLRTFFPNIYDIKHLIRNISCIGGGLQDIACQLDIPRIGQQHQAGSDSLLTGKVFFKIRDLFFGGYIDNLSFNGILYGFAPY